MTTTHRRDFFVTYNRHDDEWAEWIAGELETAGYTTVLQKWDFLPGDNFMAKMDRALAECRHTLGVLSPSYLKSVFTAAEWTAAYRQALLGKERGYIPVRVVECEPEGLLGPVAFIDLVDCDEDEARRRLLEGVGNKAERGSTRRRFPDARH